MAPIKTLIVDDHPVVREGFRTMLATDQAIEVVGEASDGLEAIAKVAEQEPDVVLMDILMPNLDGIEATRRIKDQRPSTVVIMLTVYNSDAFVVDAVRAGASGYLLKDTSRDLLIHTIRAATNGGTMIKTSLLYEAISGLIGPDGTQHRGESLTGAGYEKLTDREREVLALVAEGRTNKEIGKALAMAEDTAKKHVQNVIAKLGASDRTHATMLAARAGLIK
ncbi:MAG: response regulator [Anaerolineae bacterium]